MKRVLTSLVLIPLVIWLTLFSPYSVFWAAVFAFAVLCYREYTALVEGHGLMALPLAGYAAGLLLLAELPRYTAWLPVLVALAGLALAIRAPDLRLALATAGAFVLGVFYIFGAWASALALRQISPHWMLFAVALNWAGDISAYYGGRSLGRRKLAPRISPAKTVEGALASVVASLVFGLLYLHWALPEVPLWQVGAISIAGNIAGQCGDLAESALKRGAGVKDSGTMLPGHGGWLDRLDSSLFSMPVVGAIVSLLK
jgi:phosphatidate cytidylyltransferase